MTARRAIAPDLARLAGMALDWLTARLARAAAWCWRHADDE